MNTPQTPFVLLVLLLKWPPPFYAADTNVMLR